MKRQGAAFVRTRSSGQIVHVPTRQWRRCAVRGDLPVGARLRANRRHTPIAGAASPRAFRTRSIHNQLVPNPDDTLRIDRWLHQCRFFKTRTLAAKAVTAGHVKVNGERPAPGRRVQVGDRIELVRDRLPYALEVLAIPARRGPAAEARSCYREDEEVIRQRQERAAALSRDRLAMPRTDGRPDKRTRRLLRERKAR